MTLIWQVPGRIEVLGKHTDYAGGNVLVCAVEQGITARITPGGDGIAVSTDAFDDVVVLHAGVDPQLPAGHWARYVQTVVDRLASNFGPLQPCRLELASSLPPASGMSSSSAVLCAVALALADLNGFTSTALWQQHCPDRLALAGFLATVENGRSWGELAGTLGVGTQGESEDHTGMLCGVAGHVLPASFDPMQTAEPVALPEGWTFVVAVSGVLAEKSGAARDAYNRASSLAREALAAWNHAAARSDTSLAAAVRALVGSESPVAADDARLAPLYAAMGDDVALQQRVRHFVEESCFLVPTAVAALEAGDVAGFGQVVARSQELAETLLGNQVPETMALARLAREHGAAAASAFGAGFGGSVWALVRTEAADRFGQAWIAAYQAAFPERTSARYLVTAAGTPGARSE